MNKEKEELEVTIAIVTQICTASFVVLFRHINDNAQQGF